MPGAVGCADAKHDPHVRSGDEEQRDADHRGAEHAHLTQQDEVADAGRRERAGNEHVSGREDRPRAERQRRQRKPEEDGEQDERVAAPDARPGRVGVGADDEEERAQDAEELRHAVRASAAIWSPAFERTRREEHRRGHEQPAAGPEQDVEAAAVEEEEEQEAGDDERSRPGDAPEVDVCREWLPGRHPGSPSCDARLRRRRQRHSRRDEHEDSSSQDHQPGMARHSIHGCSCKVGSLAKYLTTLPGPHQ